MRKYFYRMQFCINFNEGLCNRKSKRYNLSDICSRYLHHSSREIRLLFCFV